MSGSSQGSGTEPMLPWHITQSMLANVPLNGGVYRMLEESGLLSPFYMDQVTEAQNGASVSYKQQLEEEIDVRRLERTMAMTRLGWLYGSDTTLARGLDSLRSLILNTGDPDFSYQRMQALVGEQDWSSLALDLSGDAGKMNGSHIYNSLLGMGQSVYGDWSALSAADKQTLMQWELDGAAGAPVAAGILRSIGYTDTMPEVVLPQLVRSAIESGLSDRQPHTVALNAYPNPANESTMVTWPQRLKNMPWELRDLFGRRLASGILNTNGVLEVDLRKLKTGLYQFIVPGTEDEQRIVVTH